MKPVKEAPNESKCPCDTGEPCSSMRVQGGCIIDLWKLKYIKPCAEREKSTSGASLRREVP